MAASATLVPMAHERKFENLRTFMVNLANSRGFSVPETKLFDQKFLDLCLSRTPDHPTYSAMIFVAITELNEEGGSCEDAISECIKSKYKNLPFAHRSLLSFHLSKLVEKREILSDYKNHCYTLPGEKKKSNASTESERKSVVITSRTNDQCTENEAVTHQNEEERVRLLKSGDQKVDFFEERVRLLKSGDQKVDFLEERCLTDRETSPKRNVIEEKGVEDTGVQACLRDSAVETLRKKGVAKEPEVALENSETDGRIEANSEGGELYQVVVLDEQNDVVMLESGKGEERKTELLKTSNTVKEACVEVKSEAYKRLWECQTEACGNIIALEKMLKQCREKDQQKKAVSEIDDVSRLPLSMESCKELRTLAQKIERQLSKFIDSTDDEAVVPYNEPRGCENKESIHEGSKKRKSSCENNGFEKTSNHLEEEKEREIDLQKKPQAKQTRVKRLKDIGTIVLRKSPIIRKPVELKF